MPPVLSYLRRDRNNHRNINDRASPPHLHPDRANGNPTPAAPAAPPASTTNGDGAAGGGSGDATRQRHPPFSRWRPRPRPVSSNLSLAITPVRPRSPRLSSFGGLGRRFRASGLGIGLGLGGGGGDGDGSGDGDGGGHGPGSRLGLGLELRSSSTPNVNASGFSLDARSGGQGPGSRQGSRQSDGWGGGASDGESPRFELPPLSDLGALEESEDGSSDGVRNSQGRRADNVAAKDGRPRAAGLAFPSTATLTHSGDAQRDTVPVDGNAPTQSGSHEVSGSIAGGPVPSGTGTGERKAAPSTKTVDHSGRSSPAHYALTHRTPVDGTDTGHSPQEPQSNVSTAPPRRPNELDPLPKDNPPQPARPPPRPQTQFQFQPPKPSQSQTHPPTPSHRSKRLSLLKPIALLNRRRSSQAINAKPSEDSHISTPNLPALPDDFDPRIKGTRTHDFSAPRPRPQQQQQQQQQAKDLDPSQNQAGQKKRGDEESERENEGPRGKNAGWNPRPPAHTTTFHEHIEDIGTSRVASTGNNAKAMENMAAAIVAAQGQQPAAVPAFAKGLPNHVPLPSAADAGANADMPAVGEQAHASLPAQGSPPPPPPPPAPSVKHSAAASVDSANSPSRRSISVSSSTGGTGNGTGTSIRAKRVSRGSSIAPHSHSHSHSHRHTRSHSSGTGGLPRHLTSSASRFSFDMAGDSVGERMLEEKHKQREAERRARGEIVDGGDDGDGAGPGRFSREYDSEFGDVEVDYDAMLEDGDGLDGLEEEVPGVNAELRETETDIIEADGGGGVEPDDFDGSSPQQPDTPRLMVTSSDETDELLAAAPAPVPVPDSAAGSHDSPVRQTDTAKTPYFLVEVLSSGTDYVDDAFSAEMEACERLRLGAGPDQEAGSAPMTPAFNEDIFDDENSYLYKNRRNDNWALLEQRQRQGQRQHGVGFGAGMEAEDYGDREPQHKDGGEERGKENDSDLYVQPLGASNGLKDVPSAATGLGPGAGLSALGDALVQATEDARRDGRFDDVDDDSGSASESTTGPGPAVTSADPDTDCHVDPGFPTADAGPQGFHDGLYGEFQDEDDGMVLSDEFDADDMDLVAAANASALENDEDGFYGREFGFYPMPANHPRHPSYHGSGGGSGQGRVLWQSPEHRKQLDPQQLQYLPQQQQQFFQQQQQQQQQQRRLPPRQLPLPTPPFATNALGGLFDDMDPNCIPNFQEPPLTPITERSEWSTRNSITSLTPYTSNAGMSPNPGGGGGNGHGNGDGGGNGNGNGIALGNGFGTALGNGTSGGDLSTNSAGSGTSPSVADTNGSGPLGLSGSPHPCQTGPGSGVNSPIGSGGGGSLSGISPMSMSKSSVRQPNKTMASLPVSMMPNIDSELSLSALFRLRRSAWGGSGTPSPPGGVPPAISTNLPHCQGNGHGQGQSPVSAGGAGSSSSAAYPSSPLYDSLTMPSDDGESREEGAGANSGQHDDYNGDIDGDGDGDLGGPGPAVTQQTLATPHKSSGARRHAPSLSVDTVKASTSTSATCV